MEANGYDKAAKKSAQMALENEADSYIWTEVKTGKLKYVRTFIMRNRINIVYIILQGNGHKI